jgi:hypothetical protein
MAKRSPPHAFAEPRDALEEVIEPYLLQQGLIARTPGHGAPDAGAERVAAPRVAGAGKARSGRSGSEQAKIRAFSGFELPAIPTTG